METLTRGFGLSLQESRVYLAALELGQATVQELSRKSGVRRTSIYNFLDKLKEFQIINETKRGKRSVYTAAHPAQLLEILRLRVNEYERALPQLLAIHNHSRRKPSVTFFEGTEGIKDVYRDALREAKPIIAWTDWEPMLKVLGDFIRAYPVERAQRNIFLQQIARDSKAARQVAARDAAELRQTKFLQSNDLKTEIMIYGNKVAVMSFRTTQPFALIIEDPGTAETLRVGWQELWKRL